MVVADTELSRDAIQHLNTVSIIFYYFFEEQNSLDRNSSIGRIDLETKFLALLNFIIF